MPTPDEVRNYQAKHVENQKRTDARQHVATIWHAVNFAEMEMPEIDWLVPSLIAPGLTTIAGQSKAGKSWLLLQLGLAVSAGGKFLCSLRCKKADVLYLALEDNNRRIKSRLLTLGMNLTRDMYIDTTNKVTPQNIEAVLDEMPTVQMVIIDTIGRYHENEGVDSNDYVGNTKLAGRLHSIAKERDIAVVMCTHTRKDPSGTDWLDSVIGSKATVAVSDTILLLTRKRETMEGKLHITGRDVEERTIEIEHAERWLWYDKNFDRSTPLDEFNEFDGSGTCEKCGGQGVYDYYKNGIKYTRRCECGVF